MSDYVFEINPEQYLYKSSHKKCYFVVHKCRLPGKNKNLFLIGDAFLKHFYSVYDFDRDTLSLGVNMHSKGKVSMYKPGNRPAEDGKVSVAQTEKDTKEKKKDVKVIVIEETETKEPLLKSVKVLPDDKAVVFVGET